MGQPISSHTLSLATAALCNNNPTGQQAVIIHYLLDTHSICWGLSIVLNKGSRNSQRFCSLVLQTKATPSNHGSTADTVKRLRKDVETSLLLLYNRLESCVFLSCGWKLDQPPLGGQASDCLNPADISEQLLEMSNLLNAVEALETKAKSGCRNLGTELQPSSLLSSS